MSDDIKTGENLDDFLINLADGLAQAQNRLNRSPVTNAMGQQAMVYHIPKMEFELHLEMTSSESSETTGKSKLTFSPATNTNINETQTSSSIIRGVMIATPAGEGLPMPILRLSALKTTARKAELRIAGLSSDGNPMINAEIQVNIDKDLSLKLNKQEGRDQALKPGTQITKALVSLDNDGKATSELVISNQEPKNQLIAVSIDFASVTETLLYRFE